MAVNQEIEKSIVSKFRRSIYGKFIQAIEEYQLIEKDDAICVCISGGKDSFLMAKLFQQLSKQSNYQFTVKYLVMNPGYNKENIERIKENLSLMEIDAVIEETDIFTASASKDANPCFYCAKYRRSALFRLAQQLGCNKIALGHHYDDVIETTLMNMLNVGSFKTMLPKHKSESGMEVIRPMYLIREKDINKWKNSNELEFINCACRLSHSRQYNSKRAETKQLIQSLKQYNENVEQNIFAASFNVDLDRINGYKKSGEYYSLLDKQKKK